MPFWGTWVGVLVKKGVANHFWSAASQDKLLSCLTFCYRHFLGWLKETVLKLARNVIRGPFCLQITN